MRVRTRGMGGGGVREGATKGDPRRALLLGLILNGDRGIEPWDRVKAEMHTRSLAAFFSGVFLPFPFSASKIAWRDVQVLVVGDGFIIFLGLILSRQPSPNGFHR